MVTGTLTLVQVFSQEKVYYALAIVGIVMFGFIYIPITRNSKAGRARINELNDPSLKSKFTMISSLLRFLMAILPMSAGLYFANEISKHALFSKPFSNPEVWQYTIMLTILFLGGITPWLVSYWIFLFPIVIYEKIVFRWLRKSYSQEADQIQEIRKGLGIFPRTGPKWSRGSSGSVTNGSSSSGGGRSGGGGASGGW